MKLSKSGLAVLGASITLLAVVPALEAAEATQLRGGGRASVSRGGGGGGGFSRGGGGGRASAAARPSRSPSAGASQRSRPSAGAANRATAADRGGGAGARDRAATGGAGARDRAAAGAGDRTRPAAGDRPGGGDRINTGDRVNGGDRINTGDRTNIRDRETNIDRGDINIDNDIDIDGDGGWGWDDGWGDHPLAAGIAFGTAAAWTSAVVGSMFYSMPPGCSPYYTSYYYCDGHYYQPQYQGDTVVYVVVDDPAQSVTVVQ